MFARNVLEVIVSCIISLQPPMHVSGDTVLLPQQGGNELFKYSSTISFNIINLSLSIWPPVQHPNHPLPQDTVDWKVLAGLRQKTMS